MPVPFRQSVRIGTYLMRQKLARRERFPLIVELEPLFQCNLACAGCGKIQQPDHVLRRRMPVEQAVGAVEECGAPMVSIVGGEPLIRPEIDTIVSELMARKRYVYLCTLESGPQQVTVLAETHWQRGGFLEARIPIALGQERAVAVVQVDANGNVRPLN